MTNDNFNKPNIEITKKARLQLVLLSAVIGFLSIYHMGTSNAYVNTAAENFHTYLNFSLTNAGFKVTDVLYTWIWSVILNSWFPGFAFGSCFAVFVTDFYGRKSGLFFGNILTFLTICLMTIGIFLENFYLFIIGRFLSAISSAISMCALILFLQEISPIDMRGKLSFFAEMSFVTTNTIGMILGMPIVLGKSLKLLIGIGIIPALISILILIPLHETPKYLLLKKNNKKKAYLDDVNSQFIIEDLNETITIEKKKTWINALRIKHVRFALILGILALQLTVSLWAIVFYSTEFLRRANFSTSSAELYSSIMLILSTISTFLGLLYIEKYNRKTTFMVTGILNTCFLITFVFFYQLQKIIDVAKYGCVISLFGHSISYSYALGPIAWFITAELVPTEYRCFCQSAALCFNQLMAFFVTLITMPIFNLIGSFAILFLFVIPSVISLIILHFWLPETKGRDVYEIINKLSSEEDLWAGLARKIINKRNYKF